MRNDTQRGSPREHAPITGGHFQSNPMAPGWRADRTVLGSWTSFRTKPTATESRIGPGYWRFSRPRIYPRSRAFDGAGGGGLPRLGRIDRAQSKAVGLHSADRRAVACRGRPVVFRTIEKSRLRADGPPTPTHPRVGGGSQKPGAAKGEVRSRVMRGSSDDREVEASSRQPPHPNPPPRGGRESEAGGREGGSQKPCHAREQGIRRLPTPTIPRRALARAIRDVPVE